MSEDDLSFLESRLSDPVWRLTSGELYKIKTADGRGIIPFKPRPEQRELLLELLEAVQVVKARADALKAVGADLEHVEPQGWQPKFVKLKARRLGWSTTIGVFVADCLGFRKDFRATLIDQTGDDATKKMIDIVKVAIEALRESWPLKLIKSNDSELTVDIDISEETDGLGASTFYATTKARGGANDLLWASELGVIQFEDERRAEEIVSGAFPSARHGVTVVETTWKGGKGGKLYQVIKPTIEGVADDWRVSFSPWWIDPRNVSSVAMHDAESLAYFASIEERLKRDGIVLSNHQRRWYAQERRTQGIFMKRENPTFLDECWTAPIDGAIYAQAIDRARTEGRICSMPVAGDCLVNTSWDLGAPKQTKVWYWQVVGREIRMIDCDLSFDGTLIERVAYMLGKGYNYGKHFVPHDSGKTEYNGLTFLTELANAGLTSIVKVPRTASDWIGINHALEMFPAIAFRSPACDGGLDALAAYRQHVEGAGALTKAEPVHDWASHPADAFRTMAEAHRAGFFKFASAADPRPDEHGRAREKRGMKQRRVSC